MGVTARSRKNRRTKVRRRCRGDWILFWKRLETKTKSLELSSLISKLDLCEGGSVSPTIFISDIELDVFPISYIISACPFVALSKATFEENSHIVFSSLKFKKRSFVTACVFDLALCQ